MRPLEGNAAAEAIERLLDGASADAVRAAIEKARTATDPPSASALRYAEGALLLRDGSLAAAGAALREAGQGFAADGALEAGELSLVAASVADIRRGIRELASAAGEQAGFLADEGSTARVRCAALVARGTSERVLGDAGAAHRSFLAAKALAGDFPELKTQVWNSLGTLYVVTGALAAARALLEPSAELCRLRGDVIGEAIAMGQLGAASLALGDRVLARRQLSRQEWLARQVGDAFGQARSLVWLAEVALELGSFDDAVELAERARAVALASGLGTFQAYADRVAGRALEARGDDGRACSERALAVFAQQRLPLGQALASWDLAVIGDEPDRALVDSALTGFASLGLVDRVVDVLVDIDADPEVLLMASSMSPRRSEQIESALVHEDPEGLGASVEKRTAARRNLSRLAAWSTHAPGLLAVATVLDAPSRALVRPAFAGAVAGTLGALALFVWADDVDPSRLVADLEQLLDLGASQVSIAHFPDARVTRPGFGAALGATVEGVDTLALVAVALAAPIDPLRNVTLAMGLSPPAPGAEAFAAALLGSKLAVITTSG